MNTTRNVKLVLLGDAGVGKSSLVVRYVAGIFSPNHESTIGASFTSKSVTLEKMCFKFQIWDTAGQEKYRALAPMYYRGAAAAIVVYDITLPSSFSAVQAWVDELRSQSSQSPVIAIAGNKSDLAEQRQISTEQGLAYAKSVGALFVETSALDNHGVSQLFEAICRALPRTNESARIGDSHFVDLAMKEPKERRSCCSLATKPPA